jgi:hypothetical protein
MERERARIMANPVSEKTSRNGRGKAVRLSRQVQRYDAEKL